MRSRSKSNIPADKYTRTGMKRKYEGGMVMLIRFLAVLMGLVFALASAALFAEEKASQENAVQKQSEQSAQPELLATKPVATAQKQEEKTTKQEEKIQKFKEVVVTATRTEKDIEDTPGDVHVITKRDLEIRNVQSLDGALKEVPGVYSRREMEFSTLQPVVSTRGIAGQNRTLILVDGITLNEPRTGSGYFDGIPVEDVERIEFLKGPFSSLYGGYAMGGVVNVITKMPEKREITLRGGYGDSWDYKRAYEDLYRIYASYGDRLLDNKLAVFLSYSRNGSNGYPYQLVATAQPATGYTGYIPTTTNTGSPRYIVGNKGDGYSWFDGLTFKTQYDISGSTKLGFTFMRNNYRTNYDSPNTFLLNGSGVPVFTDGTANIRESTYLAVPSGRTRNLYNIFLETELGSVKTRLSGGLADTVLSFNTTPGSTAVTTISGGPGTYLNSPAKEYSIDLLFNLPIFSNQLLTWGAAVRYDTTDSQTYNLSNWRDTDSKTGLNYEAGGKTSTYSAFAQDEIQILNNLTTYVGARFDWWETSEGYNTTSGTFGRRSDSAFSPKAAVVYKPFDLTTVRVSGGKAFRPPSIFELYNTSVLTNITYANPDLKPETTVSWDASVTQGLWKGAKIKLAYFENYLEDLIYSQTIAGTSNSQRVNVGSARSNGVEIEIEQRIGKGLRMFADFTYTYARITDNPSNPAIVGKKVVDVPDKIFNVGADAEYGPLTASLVGRYVGKRYSTDANTDIVNFVYTSYDPFFTADAKISYKLNKYATLSLSVNNIFDEKYYVYYVAPGRSWFTELTIKL